MKHQQLLMCQGHAGEELPFAHWTLFMELMSNVTGSFAAQLACGGADADSMSEILQGPFLVPHSFDSEVWLLLTGVLKHVAQYSHPPSASPIQCQFAGHRWNGSQA